MDAKKYVLVDDDAVVVTAGQVVATMNDMGWNQTQVAEHYGVSSSHISNLLSRNGYTRRAAWYRPEEAAETPFGDAV